MLGISSGFEAATRPRIQKPVETGIHGHTAPGARNTRVNEWGKKAGFQGSWIFDAPFSVRAGNLCSFMGKLLLLHASSIYIYIYIYI